MSEQVCKADAKMVEKGSPTVPQIRQKTEQMEVQKKVEKAERKAREW